MENTCWLKTISAEVSTWVQGLLLHFSYWGCSSWAGTVGSCGLILVITHHWQSPFQNPPLLSPTALDTDGLSASPHSVSPNNDLGLFLQPANSLRMRCLLWTALPYSMALQIGFCWHLQALHVILPWHWLRGTICLSWWLNELRAHKRSRHLNEIHISIRTG